MHLINLASRALALAPLLSTIVANPLTSLDPRSKKKHHDCIKPKVFIISMV